jgi:hypothetical protein
VTDILFPHLFRELNMAVFEHLPNGAFQLVTPSPAWLENAFAETPKTGQYTLDAAFPFLEDVIRQARGAWKAGPHASLVFGPFAAVVNEDELLMRATAMTVEKHQVLILERLIGAADTRQMLQKAREHLLENEQLVRKVEALHAPATAIDRAATTLAGGATGHEEQAVIAALQSASAALQHALADLPKPPVRKRR